jgi:uncharacterized protein (DUF3820 family)
MSDADEHFRKIGTYKMPFGKYKGVRLVDIPEEYYIWMMRKGLPAGDLGAMMAEVYEIKVNGLEPLFDRYR